MIDRIRTFFKSLSQTKLAFIILGIGSTVWFLIRVIPKPTRAGYPCMKAAAPIMSGFVIYLLGLGGSALLFKRTYLKIKQARYLAAFVAFAGMILIVVAFNFNDARRSFANSNLLNSDLPLPDGANNPMGVGQGIYPGRVVWEWNTAATNEKCLNTSLTDCFFTAKNNNQDTISQMLNNSIKKLSGKNNVKEGWDALFRSFNNKKTGTPSGYQSGETIFIKVNNGQAGWAINSKDLSVNESTPIAETTPFTVLAMLTQLVDSCGVPQDKIYVGEPMTHLYKHLYDILHAKYPNVKYLDKESKNTSLGRTTISGWHADAIYYSDGGSNMPDAISDAICNEMYNANYMINMAALKAHARGGVTLCAKLHFGSHGSHNGDWGSSHLHDGLISTAGNDVLNTGVRGEYGMYRVLTDLIGHEKLGGNTVLFLVDGLWGGVEATDRAFKWQSAPFNNDWPNSLFVSQDEVALESVCLDFLRAEADKTTSEYHKYRRPFFPAVDDYLHQAADKKNWAKGITYDPEGDGTEMPSSLGVHEHWNNATDKQYTRNLGTGTGIELISYKSVATSIHPVQVSGIKSYPNPFTESILIETNSSNALNLNIYNTSGQLVFSSVMNESFRWNGCSQNGSTLPKGIYLVKLTEMNSGKLIGSEKIVANR
jgi:hypothetical protein